MALTGPKRPLTYTELNHILHEPRPRPSRLSGCRCPGAWLAPAPPLQGLHGVLSWLAFLGSALLALPLLAVLPPLRWRRAVVRQVARLTLAAGGMRLAVSGVEALPHPSVVVANHASYLDGIVLTACLPPDFGFVVKREMNSVPLAAWLLRLIGAEFVERGGQGAAARDALRVGRLRPAPCAGVLSEGTFERQPGLLHFHRGASRRGARRAAGGADRDRRHAPCLAPGTLLPRAGRIEVRFLAALRPDSTCATRPRRCATARAHSRAAGQPDLAPQEPGQDGIMRAADRPES
jgi:1-acyl-sn-glycerol-3-phosphate acyltransferase